MRFYYDPKQTDVLKQLSIHMANANFHYGFEYLDVQDKLVQTPLNDRCYLTMTQALEPRLGMHRRVQQAGGENSVRRISADPDHPGTSEDCGHNQVQHHSRAGWEAGEGPH